MCCNQMDFWTMFSKYCPTRCLSSLLVVFFLTGCQPVELSHGVNPTVPEITPSKEILPTLSPIPKKSATTSMQPLEIELTPPPRTPISFGYTYQRSDGNRYVMGGASLSSSTPVDIPLKGKPAWVVAAQASESVVWAVVLEDGRVQAFRVGPDGFREITITPGRLFPGEPPLLMVKNDVPSLIITSFESASRLTHPVVLPGGNLAIILRNGDLVFGDEAEIARLSIDALPDARLLVDERGRLLFLTGPTGRYDHGVLGDGLEASGIALLETTPELRLVRRIQIEEPFVIEGIAPIWADLTGDGRREIIVTRSHPQRGAQLVVFDESGDLLAESPFIGRSYRWRHQLAVGPFGPHGELEVVDVLTPHLNGVLAFYRLVHHELRLQSKFSGYTSHVIGTRNLDMALAGDFDGDGYFEVILPNQARSLLGAIRQGMDGAQLVWQLALDGTLSTNLAAVSSSDGGLYLGVGREDGVLRVWSSAEE